MAALYRDQSKIHDSNSDDQGLERLCNTQADLEGRLHDLRRSTEDDMIISCVIATFLCVYAFWTDIWNSPLLPRRLSLQLLHHIRRWQRTDVRQEQHLLFWVIQIGKTFAVDSNVRISLCNLEKSACELTEDFLEGGVLARRVLSDYIWSDTFYASKRGWFWERVNKTI